MLTLSTAIIGSGAAGYAAALRLARSGGMTPGSVAIFTMGRANSTSRNTGSDKQTYYKLSLSGEASDSPATMAKDLFGGRCVDGDHAMAEAALSARCFYTLCELGVPFPTNRHGEAVGYQTDHDTRGRATSAGPLTSKLMTEALEREVLDKKVPIYDHHTVVRIVTDEVGEALGFVAYNEAAEKEEDRLVPVLCKNIIWATGGPAGIYADSVYPAGHVGSTGVALEAGVAAKNLTEWQYGLASIAPRWNVSGTYMQVLPRFVSIDTDGVEHDFLNEYFEDVAGGLSMVFRKGYEWPFDSRRAKTGSSVVDLLVYRETKLRGRRVYLDFIHNPNHVDELDYAALDAEARDYLTAAGACFGTPYERLCHMNKPAVELYLSRGVDISKEYLEIALCAQHCNGGLDVDLWWQTAKPGLFAIGEAAGTHGVYRPGGSALNAGQVGALRASQYIAARRSDLPAQAEIDRLTPALAEALEGVEDLCRAIAVDDKAQDNTQELLAEHRAAMSACAGAIRNAAAMEALIARDRELLANFATRVRAYGPRGLSRAFMLRDALLTQLAVLADLSAYAAENGSRGSALYTAASGEAAVGLENEAGGLFRHHLDGGVNDGVTRLTKLNAAELTAEVSVRPVRPLPPAGGFFENVWREYRENGNVY